MGEVYRARDSKLSRDVAIKVLPADLSRDAGALTRFEREAKAVAALSHPNILAIHDFGSYEGTTYAVMELLEGESLQQRLTEGPMPQRKTLEVARDIALGLAAAHEKGIVHRDLKPANLFLTQDGRVKILDFGLARQITLPSAGDTNSPTVGQASEPGFIVGTIGYMAPEQLKGQPADARSDIFSLGAVLYEMLSGKRAFQGDSAIATMNAILKEDPPSLLESGRQMPPALERVVAHCLEKNPAERFQSARDVAFNLDSTSGGSSSGITVAPTAARKVPAPAVFLTLATVAIVAAALLGRRSVRDQPPSLLQLTFRRGTILHARYMPDGGSVIYSASWDGNPAEILTARVDGTESRPFGVMNADVLAVSSKSEVAILLKKRNLRNVIGRGTLAVIPLAGGAQRELFEDAIAADWSPDGTQLAVARFDGDRYRLEYPAGRLLYKSSNPVGPFGLLRVSNDGKQVAFVESEADQDLRVVDSAGKVTTLIHAGPNQLISGFVWRPGDRELMFSLYTSGIKGETSDLSVVDLNGHVRTLYRVTGEVDIEDGLPDRRLLVQESKTAVNVMFGSSSAVSERNIGWLDKSWLLGMSEDGSTVVFNSDADIYLRRTDGSPAVRLASNPWYGNGALSPDGKWVLTSSESGHELSMVPTGPGQIRKIPIGELQLGRADFMPNGKAIVFSGFTRGGQEERLYLIDETGGQPRAVSEAGNFQSWAVSPDGTEIAVNERPGGLKIFRLDRETVRSVAGLDPGDSVLTWSSDGGSLYVAQMGDIPVRVERFELATGRRELWKLLVPPDEAGAYFLGPVLVTRDGKFWAYTVNRNIVCDLWQVTGLAVR